ncbi:MAG: hypothetical protein J5861_01920 [Desulfovibrio sp.]|nr:hypothetical protein [Desulfovibrio sp.]
MQDNPFATAAEAGISITLLCSLERADGPKNLTLEGVLSATETHNWYYNVQKCAVMAGTCHRASKQAKFSFRIPGDGAGTGVSGQADILACEEDESGQISRMTVHFGQPVMRALRRHPRYSWKREFTRLGAIIASDHPPATRDQLKVLLRDHVLQDPRPPLILDLAAGGGRICMPEDSVRNMFSSDQLYVFFFVPSKAVKGEQPYAFLSKRLGRCNQTCPTGVAMRFIFIAEMDWASTAPVHWVNIASVGSERLKLCLERYAEDTFVQD